MFQPIRHAHPLPRFRLASLPATCGEVTLALVLVGNGRPPTAALLSEFEPTGWAWSPYREVVEVDQRPHVLRQTCKLPSRDAIELLADMQLVCSVDDPAEVVRQRVDDVCIWLWPLVLRAARDVTRSCSFETLNELHGVERSIEQAIRGLSPTSFGIAIHEAIVALQPDEDTLKYLRDLQRLRRQRRLDQEVLDHTRTKLRFYDGLIQGGQWRLQALRLARDPDALMNVTQAVAQHARDEAVRQLEFLEFVLEHDQLEPFELEEDARKVLEQLLQRLREGLRGVTPEHGNSGVTADGTRPAS